MMAAVLTTVGPMERALALRSLPLFRSLRGRELAMLAQLVREHVMPAGTVLHPAGAAVRAVHLLIEGRVREEHAGQVVARREAPEAIGLVELLAAAPAHASATAETRMTALVIDRAALLDVLEEQFPLLLQLRAVLGREIAARQVELGRFDSPAPAGPAEAPPRLPDTPDLVDCLLCLQRAAELRGLGVAVLAALVRDERATRLPAGERIFAAGEEARRFIVVAEGSVVCTPPESAAPFRAGPGDLIGHNAALTGLPYPYTAVTETPVATIGIDAQVFWDVAEDHFHVALRALSMCAARLLWLEGLRVQRGAPANGKATPMLAAGAEGG
jgi:CRP-like cAMP-binding protein